MWLAVSSTVPLARGVGEGLGAELGLDEELGAGLLGVLGEELGVGPGLGEALGAAHPSLAEEPKGDKFREGQELPAA